MIALLLAAQMAASAPTASSVRVLDVGRVTVWKQPGKSGVFYTSKLAIDADGSPHAYHPGDTGLDWLSSGGNPKKNIWWGVLTDKDGNPVIQGSTDPAPGYYVSTTSLTDTSAKPNDLQRQFVDAETVPFIVAPPDIMDGAGVKMGDFAFVWNRKNGKSSPAIVADIGPRHRIGEGSIALADALGVPDSPKVGGAAEDIVTLVFPGSGNGSARPVKVINRESKSLLKKWGGLDTLRTLAIATGDSLSPQDAPNKP